ncbi:hypothetical protein Back11_09200 [Paenibacillus baekrokdamisoli]|uniref:Uncharacterized protein n=1 Tax=Paenibacillus baekrokdamisoli TaxID=1712516 RepID=A0A3G9IU60_9BACL|nr:hypothetical protein [Paenibacillus baekrokdamisoli]MBB3067236.1 hypothetical protein [Paenibacillus baekrokdamisoli]BBH19575.1 hypothetical protein Back11_09200 [Paenibacillus baekrokdamisoli]
MKQRPELKQKKKSVFSWRRLVLVSSIVLVLFLGAAWYAYERMTDKLLEVFMDETLQSNGSLAAGIANDEVERTAVQDSRTDDVMQPTNARVTVPDPEQSFKSSSKKQESVRNTTKTPQKQASMTSHKADITERQAADAADKVTLKDKLTIGSVVMNHWSSDDLKSLKKVLSGGLSIQEKRQLKKRAMAELSENEYNALIQIAHKYGLSQGKSYKQSKEETNLSK